MQKTWKMICFITLISVLLVGCSDKTQGEEKVTDDDEVTEKENNEEVQEEADENESEEDTEEDTFSDDIKVLDVETILNDEEEVSEFEETQNTVIEHEELIYVEHDFITDVLDYELTYDEDDTFAEVFEGKGDYQYEPSHNEGAIMDIGQIYVEDVDGYENVPEDEEELYKFIEFDGKLYVPNRLINVYLKTPLNYERRDKTLELGLHSEATSIYDVGIDERTSSSAEVTQNAADVTVEGKNHDDGIVLKDINSAVQNADLDLDYNYSEIKGFIHNHSEDETIEIKFQYEDEKTLESVDLKPGDTHDFEYDVKGEAVFKILAEGDPGTASDAIIIGELK